MKRMYPRLIAVFLLAMALFVPACGGGGGGGGGGTGFLSGTWSGIFHNPAGNWPMVMTVSQSGVNINGTITVTQGGLIASGNFTGTISSATADGTITFAWVITSGSTGAATFVGTYDALNMHGTWTHENTTSGTWTVDKM